MPVTSAPTFAPGAEIAGHLVLSTISASATSARLKARDGQGRGDEVAVAVEAGADEATLTLARHHAQRLAGIGHRSLCVPTDICLTDHGMASVRPWFDHLMSDSGATTGWTVRQFLEVITAVADGLDAVHRAGLRHGAVKASNIAVDAAGHPRLLDAAPTVAEVGDDTKALGSLGVGWLTRFSTGPFLDLATTTCDAAAGGQITAADLATGLGALVEVSDAEAAIDASIVAAPPSERTSVLASVVAAVATLIAAGIAVAWVVGSADGSAAGAVVAAPTVALCEGIEAPSSPGAEVVVADLDGSGCGTPVTWWPTRAEAEVATGPAAGRFRLGERGDHLLLGDWDGDGDAEPALYRPSTGKIFSWSAWPVDGTPAPSTARDDSGVVGGEPQVIVDGSHQRVHVIDGTPT